MCLTLFFNTVHREIRLECAYSHCCPGTCVRDGTDRESIDKEICLIDLFNISHSATHCAWSWARNGHGCNLTQFVHGAQTLIETVHHIPLESVHAEQRVADNNCGEER